MNAILNSLDDMKRLAVPGAKFLRRFPNTTIPASTRIVAYQTEDAVVFIKVPGSTPEEVASNPVLGAPIPFAQMRFEGGLMRTDDATFEYVSEE